MPVVALTNRRTFLGLYAPEVLVLLFGVIAYQLFVVFEIPPRHPVLYYTQRISGNFLYYLLALLVTLPLLRLYHLQTAFKIKQDARQIDPESGQPKFSGIDPAARLSHRFTWNEFRRLYLAPRALFFDLRMINAISAMFVVFINLKHLIPWINGHLFDPDFASIEYAIFGKLMTVWMVQKFGTAAAPLLSEGYELWYTYLGICTLILIMQRNRLLAEEYCAGFVLMWMLGIVAVYLTPSWGPCFYYPQKLAAVVPVTKMNELQSGLWRMKEFVASNPASPKGAFMISGFPSLHFAGTLYCTYYLGRISRKFGLASGLFAVLTFVTTIYFGWHYLIDDIGAILLVAVVVLITRRFYRTDLVFVEPRPQVIKMGSI